MAGLKEEIPRSKTMIDPLTFRRLMKLTLNRIWLENLSEELAELWNLCNDETERSLIENLILKFTHIDSKSLQSLGDSTASYVCNDWHLSSDNTLIVAISDKSEADGSQAFIQSLKNKFTDFDGWKEANFCNRIGDSLNQLNNVKNVILLDDFIGTGNTINRKVKWYIDRLEKKGLSKNIKVHVVAIGAMEFAKAALDNLNIKYFCSVWLKKGITDNYQDSALTDAVAAMEALENKLEPKVKNKKLPSFGYKKSEALFVIEPYNIPNNVFPIFWWPEERSGKKRKRIFKRLE